MEKKNLMDSPETKYLKRLDLDEYNRVRERLSRVVKQIPESSVNGKVVLIKQENWIAVPMIIDTKFSPKTLESFVKAAKNYDRSQIIATWIDRFIRDSYPIAFSVPAIFEAVQEFYQDIDLLLMNCAVFAGKPDWVYIWYIEYVDIIYAEESIVKLFIDMKPDEAFQAFHTCLNELPELIAIRERFQNRSMADNLMAIYDDLKKFNDAPAGTEVIIKW